MYQARNQKICIFTYISTSNAIFGKMELSKVAQCHSEDCATLYALSNGGSYDSLAHAVRDLWVKKQKQSFVPAE